MAIELAPSILSANFARLGEDAKAALDGGGTVLHVDVMDGHFVPNITIGPLVVSSLRKALPNATLDCHLMIENPDNYIPAFAEAGANWISVHQEACVHLHRTLQLIESHACKPGVVLNPATPVHMLDEVLDMVHHVLIMSVNPGFGAQRFIPAFAEAGASWISVHQEACVHLHRTLQLIESHECKSGVVLNPATPVHMVDEVLDMVHHVLIMSVNPGFGAQKFIPDTLQKIKTLVEVRESLGLSFRIEIDGGVALDTVGEIVRAGAELLVAGNAVFSKGDIRENAKKLLEAARAATLTRA